jgi:LPS export ABC transporter protein LptC
VRRILLVALPLLTVQACVERGVTPQRAASADTADQVMAGMARSITRDGVRLTDVQAESAWVYNPTDITEMKRVGLTFYDASGNVRSTVTADSGVHFVRTGVLEARGNVIATTPPPGSKILKTEHLIFDKASNLIRSDTSYTFTSPTGNGSGQSFETDPDFQRFRSWQPRGYQKGQGFLLPGEDTTGAP